MARFNFKLENQQVKFDNLPSGELKESFRQLCDTVEEQLGALRCETHHREPTVFLQSDSGKVRLSGFGTCCEEFARKVQKRIKLPKEFTGTKHVRLRKLTYKYA